MSLREKVTESIAKYFAIPDGKRDENKQFYFDSYENNLYCPLGNAALAAYDKGNGAETKATEKFINGKLVISPAKMASIVSSSAMTFNLLGNDPVTINSDTPIPRGTYDVQYEKQMYTIRKGSNPSNLDAFLSDVDNKTAIFCEMKFLEWLGVPNMLKDAYVDRNCFFKSDNSAVPCPIDAYSAFYDVIMKLTKDKVPDKKKPNCVIHKSIFKHYDAWQMLKHLLAIYNYTSYTTKTDIDSFRANQSMAGKYNRIILLNVVNEFPAKCIEDPIARKTYENMLTLEHEESEIFIKIIMNSEIPRLFDNNCNAEIEVKYISAKQFADAIEMPIDKRNYLKRYFT